MSAQPHRCVVLLFLAATGCASDNLPPAPLTEKTIVHDGYEASDKAQAYLDSQHLNWGEPSLFIKQRDGSYYVEYKQQRDFTFQESKADPFYHWAGDEHRFRPVDPSGSIGADSVITHSVTVKPDGSVTSNE